MTREFRKGSMAVERGALGVFDCDRLFVSLRRLASGNATSSKGDAITGFGQRRMAPHAMANIHIGPTAIRFADPIRRIRQSVNDSEFVYYQPRSSLFPEEQYLCLALVVSLFLGIDSRFVSEVITNQLKCSTRRRRPQPQGLLFHRSFTVRRGHL
jgi:hypothetical protein